MNYKNKKILEIMEYIASQIEECVYTEKLAKLVFLSDKLFLLKYGKTITGDRFLAMARGCVGSQALALIEKKSKFINDDSSAIKEVENSFKDINKKEKIVKLINENLELDSISEAEKEVIDYIVKNFGNKKYKEISDYTHKFKEWGIYDATDANCANVDINDLFDLNFDDVDDPLVKAVSKDVVIGAKAIYNGVM